MQYKKCPKCELNYILENEDLCPICKKTFKLDLQDETEESNVMCAVCGVRPAIIGEDLCAVCLKVQSDLMKGKTVELKEDYTDEDEDTEEDPSMQDIGINVIEDTGIVDVDTELDSVSNIDFEEDDSEYDDDLWDE